MWFSLFLYLFFRSFLHVFGCLAVLPALPLLPFLLLLQAGSSSSSHRHCSVGGGVGWSKRLKQGGGFAKVIPRGGGGVYVRTTYTREEKEEDEEARVHRSHSRETGCGGGGEIKVGGERRRRVVSWKSQEKGKRWGRISRIGFSS